MTEPQSPQPAPRHTPGPWQWFERMPGRPYLATPDRGQLYVLGFERKGMQGAGPVFSHWTGIDGGAPRERKGGIMEPGLLLRDGSMHPDARLIAAAPGLLAALHVARACIELDRTSLADSHMNPHTNKLDADGQAGCDEYDAVLAQIDAAIANATGAQA